MLASAVIVRVWERIDPWDTTARLLGRWTADCEDGHAESPAAASWAVPLALAFGWYVSTYRQALLPSRVALAVAGYSVVTLGGCLAAGRVAWLTRGEPVVTQLRAVGRLRRGRLAGWAVPPGTGVVLGVLGGSFLFTALRTSELWLPLTRRLGPQAADVTGFVACAGGGGLLLWAAERIARGSGAEGTPTASAVPVIGALCIAAAMIDGQVLIAVQLLPALLGDPLGRGWDLFGAAAWQPATNPLGDVGHTATQVLILVAGGVAGARVARRRAAGTAAGGEGRALASAAAATALLVAGILAVSTG